MTTLVATSPGLRVAPNPQRKVPDRAFAVFLTGVYHYMAMALGVSASVAFLAARSETFINFIYLTKDDGTLTAAPGLILVVTLPIILSIYLTRYIETMNIAVARYLFWAFSAGMGLALSSIFVLCLGVDLAQVFMITSLMFVLMSYYGVTTKRDLTHFHALLLSCLAGLAVAIGVNLLFQNTMAHVLICLFGILLFCSLISYETQEMKYEYSLLKDDVSMGKAVLVYAVTFYMHFVNFFLILLTFVSAKK